MRTLRQASSREESSQCVQDRGRDRVSAFGRDALDGEIVGFEALLRLGRRAAGILGIRLLQIDDRQRIDLLGALAPTLTTAPPATAARAFLIGLRALRRSFGVGLGASGFAPSAASTARAPAGRPSGNRRRRGGSRVTSVALGDLGSRRTRVAARRPRVLRPERPRLRPQKCRT